MPGWMQSIEGLFAPLVTPFTDDGADLSPGRFEQMVQCLVAERIDGFILCSDTGEFAALSLSERKTLVEWYSTLSAGKPFLVHISSLRTSDSLQLADDAVKHGANGLIAMPLYYGVYSPDEQVGYLRSISEEVDSPLIVVDPLDLISEEIEIELRASPNIHLALPLSTRCHASISCYKGATASDEFAVGDVVASPMALLVSKKVAAALDGEQVDLARLVILEETLGRARISKAGLEALGMDIGPHRLPRRPLVGAVSNALRTMLAT